MSDSRVTLTGLDGSNPLAFLAALGVLRVLDHRARLCRRALPRLAWVDDGYWQPVIHGMTDIDAVIGELLADHATWKDDAALLLAYDDTCVVPLDPRTAAGKVTRDLKPRPEVMRAFLEGLASRAADVTSASAAYALRRELDTASAFGSEVVQDNNGNTKPTALHFTAGQQQFLKAVSELHDGVTRTDFEEALVGPWRRESVLPNMGWDATNARLYALRAVNPSGDKKTTVAGADWLAFIGLGTFPSVPQSAPLLTSGVRLLTTGVRGGWKDSVFTWPVWTAPVVYRVAGSICRTSGLVPAQSPRTRSRPERAEPEQNSLVHATATAEMRRASTIAAVFSAGISRSDQGGYGSFSPAEVR